jgi:hypothetical protein
MLTSVGFQVGDPANSVAVIGGWASVSIPASRTINADGSITTSGAYVQVSRLGNPLVNEVLVGVGRKDRWNSVGPDKEVFFQGDATTPGELFPILATYLNVLFGINVPPGPRGDIELALFRGIGPGNSFGVPITTHPGEVYADELRLNTAVQPTPFSSASRLGYLGGDVAGFPNGRRPCDDVVDIELRVVAGVLQGGAFGGPPNNLLGDGVDFPERGCRYFFPFMWSPTSGFAAFHAGPAQAQPGPGHFLRSAQVKAIRDSNAKGFPEGISDEEFAERVRVARDHDDLMKIQPANVK